MPKFYALCDILHNYGGTRIGTPQHNLSRDELVSLLDQHLADRPARPLWEI